MSKHLIEIELTIKDILLIPSPLTVDKMVSYLLQWYEQKSLRKLQRAKIPIITESLLKKTKIVIKVLKMLTSDFDETIGIRILQRIRKVIIMINESCNMEKHQAPIVSWEMAKRIADKLWNDTSVSRGSSIKSIRKRKAAATALLLTNSSGSRWQDLHRVRWEDLSFSCQNNKKIVQAKLRLSKNNLCNDFPQSLTWAARADNSASDCPWEIFKRWWVWCKKPKRGPIFQYRDGKPIQGDSTIYFVRRQASKLGFSNHELPGRHSGRVTHVLTLEQMNVSKRRIMRGMNWRSDKMINYYMNRRDMTSDKAPATLLARMPPAKLKKIQKDLN